VWRSARSCFSARVLASMYLEVGVGESLGDGRAIGRDGMGSEGVGGAGEGELKEEEESKRRDEGREGERRGVIRRVEGALVALLQAVQADLADRSMRRSEREGTATSFALPLRSSHSIWL
jgi:hypothetical protein